MNNNPQSPTRLAIAISLYDRWDELQGLLELLRLNWNKGAQLYIVVTSTAEQSQRPAWVNQSLADEWHFGSTYPLPKKKSSWFRPWHDILYGKFKRQLRSRTVDCICRGCRHATSSDRAYTMHLHAAAWPLDEGKIYEFLNKMQQGGYVAGGRGYGNAFIDGKHPAGDIDDNFFIINNAFARETNFWELDPTRNADMMGAEGQIARRLKELAALDRMYFFDNFSKPEDYIFPPGTTHRRVQPYNYHKPTGLLRSHDMSWQAKLCAERGYHGPYLDQLIKEKQWLPDSLSKQSAR